METLLYNTPIMKNSNTISTTETMATSKWWPIAAIQDKSWGVNAHLRNDEGWHD